MRLRLVLLALFALTVACGSGATVVQTVVVTATAEPTAVPTAAPTAAPAEVFDSRWTHSPEYNNECNYECEVWIFYDNELIAQVYSDGIAFGVFMVGTGDATEEGEAMAEAAIRFGVPANVVSQAGEDIAAANFTTREFGAWGYGIELLDDLLMVSFVHDGPVDTRLG